MGRTTEISKTLLLFSLYLSLSTLTPSWSSLPLLPLSSLSPSPSTLNFCKLAFWLSPKFNYRTLTLWGTLSLLLHSILSSYFKMGTWVEVKGLRAMSKMGGHALFTRGYFGLQCILGLMPPPLDAGWMLLKMCDSSFEWKWLVAKFREFVFTGHNAWVRWNG